LLDKALNELQTDQRTMRTIIAAETQAKIVSAEDRLKMESPPQLPGRLGQFQKNLDEKDKAEMRNRIRKGEDPGKVVDEILKRKEQQADAIPDRNKGVMDLLK
jgi:hypothetical protein